MSCFTLLNGGSALDVSQYAEVCGYLVERVESWASILNL